MPALLTCTGCAKKFKVNEYKPAKFYKCTKCGGRLENPGAEPTTTGDGDGEQKLRLEGEPVQRVWEIPVRLGRYVIDGELGRGAMGVVYKAHQEGLDRHVAIKMMLAGWARDAEAMRRFQREAKAAAKLRHPNIVSIHEIGTYKDQPFFTMDFIPGRGLDKVIEERPLSPREAARVVRDVARAMHHAHEHGIIHRDLKPANVLVDRQNKVYVTDFGLAKDLDKESMLSMTGDVMGTPGYMAPEQAEGLVHDLDRRADIYALGAILYRLVCGRPPFEGPTLASTIYSIVNEFALEPIKINPDLPADLNAIIVKAIDKERQRRYLTAEALAEDLDNFIHGRDVTARPPAKGRATWLRLKKHRKAAIAVAASAAVALVALLGYLIFSPSYLDHLEQQLASDVPEMREAAFLGLMQEIGQPRQISDTARASQIAAAYAGQHDEAGIREALVTNLEPPGVAEAQWSAFGPVVRAWLPLTDPVDLCVRQIRLTARGQDRDAVPAWHDLARGQNAREIRVAAVQAMVAFPDIRSFEQLGRLMFDPDVGEIAREGQRRMTEGIPGIGGVGEALGEMSSLTAQHNQMIEDVLNMNQDRIATLIDALPRATYPEQIAAVQELAASADPRIADALFGVVERGPEAIANAATEALLARQDVLRERWERVLREGQPHARRAAAYAISRIGGEGAQQLLLDAMNAETDEEVRRALTAALDRLTR